MGQGQGKRDILMNNPDEFLRNSTKGVPGYFREIPTKRHKTRRHEMSRRGHDLNHVVCGSLGAKLVCFNWGLRDSTAGRAVGYNCWVRSRLTVPTNVPSHKAINKIMEIPRVDERNGKKNTEWKVCKSMFMTHTRARRRTRANERHYLPETRGSWRLQKVPACFIRMCRMRIVQQTHKAPQDEQTKS